MLLRPRKFKHKNIHKRRSLRFARKMNLKFGQVGLRLLQPVRLNSKQMFRYKLFLKKAAKRSDKTLRYAWFGLFPHLPISRKVDGARMGKGKGKLAGWSTEVPAGINLLEFRNLRPGRASYYCRQLLQKVPSKARIVYKNSAYRRTTSLIWGSHWRVSRVSIW